MANDIYRELRSTDYDRRKAIKDGSMALGNFIRKGVPISIATLERLVSSADQLTVVGRLLEACIKKQQSHARGGFVSEGVVGEELFVQNLEAEAYPYHDEQVAQLLADYQRRVFWYRLFTLGLGKNPPEEPMLPDHPLAIALNGLICSGLVECVEHPDSPKRANVLFPSCELIGQLSNGRQAAAG